GNPETTTGGRAVKFYASIRIEVRKGSQITEGKDILGNELKFKVVKNKLSAPYKVTQSEILFSKGIDRYNELPTIGIENKIFDKKGSWYYYKENNVAQGTAGLKPYI
ncbi:DNA recombination/repair protein RecA, partial [Mycoplasmopsis synoviae]